MTNIPAPALDDPLQTSTTTFTLGQSNPFSAFGANFNSGNVLSVDISSNTVTWTTNSWSVSSSTTISLTGTPNQGGVGNAIGDLIVTINKGRPNQNSATANNINYNPPSCR